MKNKVLKILSMFIIIALYIGLLNNSYAASVCTIKGVFSPSNPQPGQEVTIDISATEINEGITGLSFSLEYDAEKFEIISATATDEWELSQTESLYTILTKNYEATTSTGKVATLKLKVMENAPISQITLKLTNIEVTTDDADSVAVGDISQSINIIAKEEQQENNPSENDNTPEEDKPSNVESDNENNENTNNESINDNSNNNNNQNQQPTEKPANSTEIDNNKIVVVNKDTNSGSSTKTELTNKDSSTIDKSLPKTGRPIIYTIAIVVALIGVGASFIVYRKYKNI